MVRSRPPSGTAPQTPPATRGGAAQRSPRPPVKTSWWSRLAGRLGLTGALTLCALLACALFIPMTVYGAQSAASGPGPEIVEETAAPPIVTRTTGVSAEADASVSASSASASSASVPSASALLSPPSDPGGGTGGGTGSGSSVTSSGVLLATLPWGDGDGHVGLDSPTEGLVRGPEALAVAPNGRIAVLDSVNRRVLVLAADGAVTGSLPLNLQEPRFLAVTNTRIYVLDCDADQKLVQLAWSGASYGTLSLPALPDAVSGLFATASGPCVEVAHGRVYRISGLTLAKTVTDLESGGGGSASDPVPISLPALSGRPADLECSRQVAVSFATGGDPRAVSFSAATPAGLETTLDLRLPSGRVIDHLLSVDGLSGGGLIVGARLVDTDAEARSLFALRRFVFLAGGALVPASQANGGVDSMLLVDRSGAYVGQPYVISPDGRVVEPVASEDGYSIFVHTFGGSTATSNSTGTQTGGM